MPPSPAMVTAACHRCWWRARAWLARQPPELLVLRLLLLVLTVSCIPTRFPSLYYEYIPAERLTAELLPPPRPADGQPPLCAPPSPLPAEFPVDQSPATDSEVAALAVGAPVNCTPHHRVAVVVPYRARADQLRIFLRHMHPFLRAQRLDYSIYVVEQTFRFPFNRGKLLNIGVAEAVAASGVDCVVLHDVDLLPENLGNVYACGARPRHLSVLVSSLRYQLPYSMLAGGVLAITVEAFRKANGFSNLYFGWGAEDDDLAERLVVAELRLTRPDPRVSRYTMLEHRHETPSEDRIHLLREARQRAALDGLNSLRYTVLAREDRRTHHWIRVEV
ncbi:beta-1,4-galactosyltransferase 3-like [Amphibalanus amphitrite]|uniref:beta-1,4-galactosyltransferase 3-like n=1 Tax=Amphibalanus amphitrite TaxID=1232801 RepID=UPI001C923570|nr:beta-1,4-galactosyltransferase 3-like [Amphibalanus amphitrite]XP_043247345.1 beta-1,4-galactosyltransferase 3-like [Amphibalanus amphitrite]